MRQSIFTKEQDSILCQHYPTKGANFCLAEVGNKTGDWFTYVQIRNRIKRLGLTLADGVTIAPRPDEPKIPLWEEWPSDLCFVGPNPNVVGKYLIISYLGFRRQPLKRGHHVYRVKCTSCGRESERLQESIIKAAQKNARGCVVCAKSNHVKALGRRMSEDEIAMEKAKREWEWILKTMPVTPLKFIPWENRFDSQRSLVY